MRTHTCALLVVLSVCATVRQLGSAGSSAAAASSPPLRSAPCGPASPVDASVPSAQGECGATAANGEEGAPSAPPIRQASPSWLWVHSPDVSLAIDAATGMPAHVNASLAGGGGFASDLTALSWLGENSSSTSFSVRSALVSSCGEGNLSVCVTRTAVVVGENPDGSCCAQYNNVTAVDTYDPVASPSAGVLPSSIAWTFSVAESASGSSWRTRIVTDVAFAGPGGAWLPGGSALSDAAYWAPRSGPIGGGAWSDPTALLAVPPAQTPQVAPAPLRLQYGVDFIYDETVSAGREVMPVPAAVTASLSLDAGMALFHDPGDALVAAYADVAPASTSFSRLYNRLGAGASAGGKGFAASFTTHFVPLAGADWRPAFAWARGAFPPHFLPASLLQPAAKLSSPLSYASDDDLARRRVAADPPSVPPHLVVGQGLYTCADAADWDIPFLSASSVSVNWDAHFWWPYIGMFIPPNASWASNTGTGEEGVCGSHFEHGQVVSLEDLNSSYARSVAYAGVRTLPYFNFFEWGENVTIAPPPSPPLPPSEVWTNSSLFLAQELPGAALPGPVYTGWQGGVVLDPGSPTWADFLVSQAQIKVDAFGPNFRGLAIDRMDHTSQVNKAVDTAGGDGWDVAWCGGPCRFLLWGWKEVAARIADTVYDPPPSPQRIITINFVGSQRVDTLASVDGIFSEDYREGDHSALLAAGGIATTGKPPFVVWTYSWEEIQSYGPDAYMAGHLFVKAFPCAPVLGADHTVDNVTAGAAGRQLYLDYGQMFTALRGGCWHVAAARPVTVDQQGPGAGRVAVNAFTVGGGCTSAAAAAGNGPVGAVVLFAWQPDGASQGASVVLSWAPAPGVGVGGEAVACESIVPGGNWTQVTAPAWDAGRKRWAWETGLSMARGSVMVRCTAG